MNLEEPREQRGMWTRPPRDVAGVSCSCFDSYFASRRMRRHHSEKISHLMSWGMNPPPCGPSKLCGWWWLVQSLEAWRTSVMGLWWAWLVIGKTTWRCAFLPPRWWSEGNHEWEMEKETQRPPSGKGAHHKSDFSKESLCRSVYAPMREDLGQKQALGCLFIY